MPDEKLNDINEVHSGGGVTLGPLHPSDAGSDLCWCGNEPMHRRGPTCHMAAGREIVTALTKSVNRLCAILEAIATHGGTLTLNKMDDAAPRAPVPLQPGDRASYNGRRGVLRSIGVAGTGILYDDGRYALLTNAMAAKLVRE